MELESLLLVALSIQLYDISLWEERTAPSFSCTERDESSDWPGIYIGPAGRASLGPRASLGLVWPGGGTMQFTCGPHARMKQFPRRKKEAKGMWGGIVSWADTAFSFRSSVELPFTAYYTELHGWPGFIEGVGETKGNDSIWWKES